MRHADIDAILLDMDGTLVDSDAAVERDADVGLQAGRAAGATTAALKGLDGDVRLEHLGQLATLLAS
ncbi:beta-phosphoglucomutase-like phosphatase (HAD superfamily) [Actinoplanes campanulatus]|uniref:Beta-phosphoglucomutase-like phosphatase (HAD superfamily) n=1 Tax=Actinoplanes campanulatus TaxID=113559 RepID=A0A7W5FJ34_9ACTN|nr:hypothetical protein [Actinoplanes campanulatus]MBB3100314.1 beta-phosphoglucomutase-like phosphatase (HAD superfamily) [Actinoplanes campanulatus]GGN43915.1 hypothetical protein GCM10010109_76560 [Actinoplanes campanulatus]GID40884.1 hypothetical protein Aca09nite_73900 [Actinoplanes campanulatus]